MIAKAAMQPGNRRSGALLNCTSGLNCMLDRNIQLGGSTSPAIASPALASGSQCTAGESCLLCLCDSLLLDLPLDGATTGNTPLLLISVCLSCQWLHKQTLDLCIVMLLSIITKHV